MAGRFGKVIEIERGDEPVASTTSSPASLEEICVLILVRVDKPNDRLALSILLVGNQDIHAGKPVDGQPVHAGQETVAPPLIWPPAPTE